MEFKELTVEELTLGYIQSPQEESCTCIFCGEVYEEGYCVSLPGQNGNCRKSSERGIFLIDMAGVFHGLLDLDKQVNGLSEIQKDVLTGMYLEKDNKQICEEMGISAATVRSHKFNLQNRNERRKFCWHFWNRLRMRQLLNSAKRQSRKLYQ